MFKRLLCKLFNLTPIQKLWNSEKELGNKLTELWSLTICNENLRKYIDDLTKDSEASAKSIFQLYMLNEKLEKENTELRTQAEEAIKDMAIQTGEILSLKNQLSYCKAELTMSKLD